MNTTYKLKPKQKPTIDNGGVVELEKVSDHPEWQDYLNHLSKLPSTFAGEFHKTWHDVKLENEKRLREARNSVNSESALKIVRENLTKLDGYNVAPAITKAVEKIVEDLKLNLPKEGPDSHDKNLFRGIPPSFFNGNNQLHFTNDEQKMIHQYGGQQTYRKDLFKRHCFISKLTMHTAQTQAERLEVMRVAKLNQYLVTRLNQLPLIEDIYLEDAPRNANHRDLLFMKKKPVKKAA